LEPANVQNIMAPFVPRILFHLFAAMSSSSVDQHPTDIPLSSLLSACVDASLRGCSVIQSYAPSLAGGGTDGALHKEANNPKSVVTAADIEAQKVIVDALRKTFGPKLRIIGEEDDDDGGDGAGSSAVDEDDSDVELLRMDILAACTDHEECEEEETVPLSDYVLYVDPLDGTREFVEGRVENVACLIGIASNDGRAVAGAVGVPFPKNGDDGAAAKEACTYYAMLSDSGPSTFGVYPPTTGNEIEDTDNSGNDCGTEPTLTVLTGDSTNPILRRATDVALSSFSDTNHVIIGGTAAKLVETARRPNTISILHFKTCLWDTCSTDALLHAQGGRVTDLFGSSLSHSPDSRRGGGAGKGADIDIGFTNVWGVVASSPGAGKAHDELCRAMRADPEAIRTILGRWMGEESVIAEPQAIDVARDLDGAPLSREWLEEHLESRASGCRLKGYTVPEVACVRMMMSTGCRIVLDWNDEERAKEANLPNSVFFKRVVMNDLDHARAKLKTAPHKLARDVRSYQVECNFLTSEACKSLIKEAGIHINAVYGSDLRPASGISPKEQLKSRFAMLLEDFASADGWHQEWLLGKDAAFQSLRALARMHAYFWIGSNFWKKDKGRLGQELEDAVWPNGGYMQPQLQGEAQLGKVANGWKQRLPSFIDDLRRVPELKDIDLESIGARVERVAKFVGKKAHPFAPGVHGVDDLKQYRTFVHGDPKQANYFLRRRNDGTIDVGSIDFQWAGFGLAATDVAHHIAAALQGAFLSDEEGLLDHYYSCLTEALVEFGVSASTQDAQEKVYPRHVFQSQYEVALIDICRMVYAYAWTRWKPEPVPTPASFNRNSYNKSLANALWLVKRCVQLLDKREDEWMSN